MWVAYANESARIALGCTDCTEHAQLDDGFTAATKGLPGMSVFPEPTLNPADDHTRK